MLQFSFNVTAVKKWRPAGESQRGLALQPCRLWGDCGEPGLGDWQLNLHVEWEESVGAKSQDNRIFTPK